MVNQVEENIKRLSKRYCTNHIRQQLWRQYRPRSLKNTDQIRLLTTLLKASRIRSLLPLQPCSLHTTSSMLTFVTLHLPGALPSCQSLGPSLEWLPHSPRNDFCILWGSAHFLLLQVVLLPRSLPTHGKWDSWPSWIHLLFTYHIPGPLLLPSSHGQAVWWG